MASSIKLRASAKGDETTVKCLMTHPMETGTRKDKAGKPIPAHYITEVTGDHNGATVMTAYWGGGVSKNPYLSFKFKGGKPGDEVKISWVDNQGKSDSATAKIK